ncbi:MAG: hypothetical protein IJW60_03260 [Clostridia bacterium]|nr:hypothetical protein [Clostridia bacterium]
MPKSLEYIKLLSEGGIAWKSLHVIDAFSLVCALRLDMARKYLAMKGQDKLKRAGVRSITPATQADFDAL